MPALRDRHANASDEQPPMPALDPLAIDALLPQTQCTRCGFAGCLPYAEAIAAGSARINQCPPGGDAGIRALAARTGLAYEPLDPEFGVEAPRTVAVVDEALCIGCTICIQKCPVDAIVGAAKLMHTVLTAECTGCELCVAPCPVDCIHLVPAAIDHPARIAPNSAAALARVRHRARLARLVGVAETRKDGHAAASDAPGDPTTSSSAGAGPEAAPPLVGSSEHKQWAVRRALERARGRRPAAQR
jgi:electron transport complex protein RnfB